MELELSQEIEWRQHPTRPYLASSLGDVRHIKSDKIRKTRIALDGYRVMNVHLWGHSNSGPIKVAKIVCEAFHGLQPFDGAEILHGERGKACDEPSNLRWGTHQENLIDRRRHGSAFPRNRRRLTPAEVMEIRALHGEIPIVAIAAQFSISRSNVRFIVQRKIWKEIP